MNKKIMTTFILLSTGFTHAAMNGHVVVQAGAHWSTQGKAQHINITNNLIGDDFTLTRYSHSNALFGLGYYVEGKTLNNIQLSYGINAFYLPNTSVSGTVLKENLFSNLAYAYRITHAPIYAAVKAKTNLPMKRLSLTADAGLGPNIMRADSFVESPLDGITSPDNPFSAHTTTTFSATAGIGVQVAEVLGTMPLECGYRFFYLGNGRLARSNAGIINPLTTGTAYTNALVCSLSM